MRRVVGEQELQVALDAVLLERRRFAHVVRDVGEHLDEPDLEAVLAAARALADHEQLAAVLDHRRRRHPVQRLVPAGVRVHEHGAVVLQHQEPRRLRQEGVQAAGVGDLAAGDDQAHRANLPSVPDMSQAGDALGRILPGARSACVCSLAHDPVADRERGSRRRRRRVDDVEDVAGPLDQEVVDECAVGLHDLGAYAGRVYETWSPRSEGR